MTVHDSDITVTINGKEMVFPDISLLYSFTMHARFPVMETDEPLHIVDVGGCVGGFTLASMINIPNATFDVIEPWSGCYPYLKRNLGNLPNVTLYKIAISNKFEAITLSLTEGYHKMGQSSVYGDGINSETVDAMPLDNLVEKKVDLLKIDVEGYEYTVLEGSNKIIDKWHPRILLEVKDQHQKRAGHTSKELIAFLVQKGYPMPESIGNDYWFVWNKQ